VRERGPPYIGVERRLPRAFGTNSSSTALESAWEEMALKIGTRDAEGSSADTMGRPAHKLAQTASSLAWCCSCPIRPIFHRPRSVLHV
jgi:hypothetical protein